MSHSIAGCGSTAHSIFLTFGSKRIPNVGFPVGLRTFLAVPLRQHGELVGELVARRTEVRPFTPAQIKLLETFADQAVIALENVRLFQELKESLEQQTATSEILGVIASSPTDIQPVLDLVAENAARLCDATDAQLFIVSGGRSFVIAYSTVQCRPSGDISLSSRVGRRPSRTRQTDRSRRRCRGGD